MLIHKHVLKVSLSDPTPPLARWKGGPDDPRFPLASALWLRWWEENRSLVVSLRAVRVKTPARKHTAELIWALSFRDARTHQGREWRPHWWEHPVRRLHRPPWWTQQDFRPLILESLAKVMGHISFMSEWSTSKSWDKFISPSTINIYRLLHLTVGHTFFSGAHKAYTKADHMLVHKKKPSTNLKELQHMECGLWPLRESK